MTVLLEGMSLVFENRSLADRYPGGIAGFRLMWDNGSFCTDGTISRISFFESSDAFCTLMSLPDYGIEVSQSFATDVGVFLHGGRPWKPCLWLEVSLEGRGAHCCWHTNEAKDERAAVPSYFRPGHPLVVYGNLDEESVMSRIVRVGDGNGRALFCDQSTNRIFAGPRQLQRH
jgi:hypothetical protein